MDGTFTGVVDRIVDDATAVILVEEDGSVVEQVTVPAEDLPAEGEDEGGRLSLRFRDGDLVSIEHTGDASEREESIREKFDRLSKRLSGE